MENTLKLFIVDESCDSIVIETLTSECTSALYKQFQQTEHCNQHSSSPLQIDSLEIKHSKREDTVSGSVKKKFFSNKLFNNHWQYIMTKYNSESCDSIVLVKLKFLNY
ncbi:hypothetical protein T11_11560 [Trichinella zimbabwensis]|uniref:Uncharacterized protein n=1 Tax=Trichinella zimbabwensis TaxID=268475 RepID=A0A0V1HAW6_9BILA|nr:hypothetical protein T11_11560 [Trichinella zimbabwensis]